MNLERALAADARRYAAILMEIKIMKYYVYISDTKIEMFYSQLAHSEGRESASSLGVDLKVFKAEVKKSRKIANTKYTKLEAILNELEDSELIGDIDSNKPYIKGDLEMIWASFGMLHSPITFWGYLSQEIALGLAGSRHHVLGAQPKGITDSQSDTTAIATWFLKQMGDLPPKEKIGEWFPERFGDLPPKNQMEVAWLLGLDEPYHPIDDDVVTGCIWCAVATIRGQKNRFEFVAKVLHRSKFIAGAKPSHENNVLLATPLYVAMR